MASSLYIVTLEPDSGKLVVTVGLMELLTRTNPRVGFFRPIIPQEPKLNNEIEVVRRKYHLSFEHDEMYGYRHDEALALSSQGRSKEMMESIIASYKNLLAQCDVVLCLGLDISGLSSNFDFDINVAIARDLGCPILNVTTGQNKSVEEIIDSIKVAEEIITKSGCEITATVVPRMDKQVIYETSIKIGRASCRERV